MDYPSLPLLASSTLRREAGISAARATNGRLLRRRLWPQDKHEFELTHWLTEAQAAALEAHYQAHRDLSFAFVWPDDGMVRTVGYTQAPLPTRAEGYVLVVVKLAEV
jgi:glycine/D-amino acid oxidase-like deaminating enzyme